MTDAAQVRRARTARQRLVPEIGHDGDAAIAGAAVVVSAEDASAAIEARYLAGAGFGLIRVRSFRVANVVRAIAPDVVVATDAPPIEPPKTKVEAAMRAFGADESAVAVAAGAARAVGAIRRAVKVSAS
ncbi:MAG: hypothetical protein ACHREM_16520 [Polyangiales bacterium]